MDKIDEYVIISDKIKTIEKYISGIKFKDKEKEKRINEIVSEYNVTVFFFLLFLFISLCLIIISFFSNDIVFLAFSLLTFIAGFFSLLSSNSIVRFVFKSGGKKKLISSINKKKLKKNKLDKKIKEMIKIKSDIEKTITKDIVIDYINRHEDIDKKTYDFLNHKLNYFLNNTITENKKNNLMLKIEKIEEIEKKYEINTN